MKTLDRISKILGSISGWVSMVFVVAMMAIIVVDVVTRFVLKSGILGSYEIVQLFLSIFVFFSFPFAQYHNRLIRITLILEKLNPRGRAIVWALGGALATVICILLAYALFIQAGTPSNLFIRTDILRITIYPFYYIASFALMIFAITLTFDLIKSVAAIFKPEFRQDHIENPEKV